MKTERKIRDGFKYATPSQLRLELRDTLIKMKIPGQLFKQFAVIMY
jgi:hypothetical protein